MHVGASRKLLRWECFALICHIWCVFLFQQSKYYSIATSTRGQLSLRASHGEQAASEFLRQFFDADYQIKWLITVAYLMFILEAISILLGSITQKPRMLALLLLIHTFCAVTMFWMVLEGWRHTVFVALLIVGSIVPGFIAAWNVAERLFIKSETIRRFDIRI